MKKRIVLGFLGGGGGGVLLILALSFTACPNVVDENPGAAVSKEALSARVGEAQTVADDVEVSADGFDVDPDAEWVTQAVKTALEESIAAARTVLDNGAATQDEVDAALAALNAAIETFNGAKQPGNEGAPVSKETLSAKVGEAQTAADEITVSADGFDVDSDAEWVTQAVKTALEEAIAAAQTVLDNGTATQNEVNEAYASLAGALADFNDAKQPGLNTPVNKTALSAAISAAQTAADEITVSADGADVDSGTNWVTQAVKTALEDAITAAQGVLDNGAATQEEVDAAVTALNDALEIFNGAKQPGLISADKEALAAAITAAQAAAAGPLVSNDGTDIFRGLEWVSQAVKAALEGAITTAQEVFDNGAATQGAVDAAVTTLSTAVETFNGAIQTGTKAAELALRYDFSGSGETVTDLAGSNTGALYGGAALGSAGGINYMDTGSGDGYLDMGAAAGQILTGQDAFTISAYVNTTGTLSGNGWFLWMFSSVEAGTSSAGYYTYFRTVNTRHVLSQSGWGNETAITTGSPLQTGVWKHVLIRQTGYEASIFIDGVEVQTGAVSIKPTGLAAEGLTYNYLAKPCFSGDNYMKDTKFADFRIYRGALSNAEIAALDISDTLIDWNGYDAEAMIDLAVQRAAVSLGDTSTVTADLALPAGDSFINVQWQSSNLAVLSNTGAVTRPTEDHVTLTLTGTFSAAFGSASPVPKTWTVRVLKQDASFEDFLVLKLELDESNQLVNTAPSGDYYSPALSGTAAVESSTVGETVYKAVNTGGDGYIDLGPQLGSLLRKTQWTIEFYINTPADSGDMLAFANEETPASRGTVRFYNTGLNFRTYTAGSGGTQTNTGNSGGIGARAGKWVHLTLVRNGNYIGIYRNGGQAQNNRETNFSSLTTNALFGAESDNLYPLRYGYLGKPLFASTSNVANVKFYGFKAYSAALLSLTGSSGNEFITLDGETAGDITNAMRDFKAALNAAFGLEDSAN